jgi:mRNA-degrading endonuclease toxin of MazEF toxin-antitoxin module
MTIIPNPLFPSSPVPLGIESCQQLIEGPPANRLDRDRPPVGAEQQLGADGQIEPAANGHRQRHLALARQRGRALLDVPLTTRAKGGSFEVPIRGGKRAKGVILANELRTVDCSARRAEKFDACPPDALADVRAIAEALVRG